MIKETLCAEHDRDVAIGAERLGVERGKTFNAGVARRLGLDRDREAALDQESGDRAELFANGAGVELADERSVPEAGRHMRGITPQRPLFPQAKMGLLPSVEPCSTIAPRPS